MHGKTNDQSSYKEGITIDSALSSISKAILSTNSIKEVSNLVLNSAKELTGSKYGYVGYIDPNTGYFIAITLTRDIWKECDIPDKKIVFEKFKGLWGWVLENKKPLVTNDPRSDPRSEGTPEGHIEIDNFLSVPAMMENQLIGQISVANSDESYNNVNITNLTRLADLYAIAIHKILMEKALRQSEKKYKSITELSQEIIMRITPEGNYTYINKYGEDFFEKSVEEMTNNNFLQDIHPSDIKTTELLLKSIEKDQETIEGHITNVEGPKGSRAIRWNMSPIIDETRNVIEIQASGRDITDLQEELIEKNKLAAVGQLAAGIAHEINTPLANIELTAEYLLNIIKADENKSLLDTKLLRSELQDVKKEIQKVTNIVNELLKFSRRIYLTPDKVNINSLIIKLIKSHSLQTKIREKNVKLHLEIPDDLETMGDESLLAQVFQNVLNNSLEAMVENKDQPKISITGTSKKNNILIKIKDNGRGIKHENLTRVFEPFYTSKSAGNSSGLGLSICRGIIEKHKGRISINSIYGKETEVTIRLPSGL